MRLGRWFLVGGCLMAAMIVVAGTSPRAIAAGTMLCVAIGFVVDDMESRR